ncbi:vesicle transport through interaction with t-SNAREs homolog 1B [Homalodisca vitripennis]|uniref:vesicle transport through interaction with t-SNAREs homolog 1B n=1 Tax=Homalodisca vitripennis TaxID=197043 RepID=UPI001EECD6EE|nr:vesicle transport through interaction with t-SNAREs homolog 1B [Homalodisca vitripennis]
MMTSWEERQRNTLLDGRRALEQTSESLARSERTALETEAIGVEVVSNLGTQRETLQRARNRLEDIDQGLSTTNSILNTMTRRVFTNKLLLVLIILCECGILASLIFIRFIKH